MSTPHQNGFIPSKFILVITIPGGAKLQVPCQTAGMPEITGDIEAEADSASLESGFGLYPDLNQRKN